MTTAARATYFSSQGGAAEHGNWTSGKERVVHGGFFLDKKGWKDSHLSLGKV